MKLLLRAYIKQAVELDLYKQIYNFFKQDPRFLTEVSGFNTFYIRIIQSKLAISLQYDDYLWLDEEDDYASQGLLTESLYELLETLIEQVNQGDLGKLQELADTFIAWEERFSN